MRFFTALAILATALTTVSVASPLPSFRDIERRWSEGQSEAQIHHEHDIREATPAWNLERGAEAAADGEFTLATDERTMKRGDRHARLKRGLHAWLAKKDEGLTMKMKDFVTDFMRSRGKSVDIVIDQDDAPVLKPRRGEIDWHFH